LDEPLEEPPVEPVEPLEPLEPLEPEPPVEPDPEEPAPLPPDMPLLPDEPEEPLLPEEPDMPLLLAPAPVSELAERRSQPVTMTAPNKVSAKIAFEVFENWFIFFHSFQ
jgi:hypothetical protein